MATIRKAKDRRATGNQTSAATSKNPPQELTPTEALVLATSGLTLSDEQNPTTDLKQLGTTRVDEKDQKVADSGVPVWFEAAGIPVSYSRKKQSETSTKWRSASSTTPDQLRHEYGWEFDDALPCWKNEGTVKIAGAIQETVTILNDVGDKSLTISIPNDWSIKPHDNGLKTRELLSPRLTNSILTISLQPLLELYNNRVKKTGAEHGLFIHTEHIVKDKHNVKTSDVFSNTQLRENRTAAQTILSALFIRGTANCGSELSVERHLGGVLPGFFEADGCTTIANMELKYPTVLGCWGSYPKPDLALRLNCFGSAEESKHGPVVLLGEAKKLADDAIVPAQLACAVQPTLQLFAAHLTEKYRHEDGTWSAEWDPLSESNPAQIPVWMRIHGMRYDRHGFVFHVFYPRYQVQDDGKLNWKFVCTTLTGMTTNKLKVVFDNNNEILPRANLLKTLIYLKKEALKSKGEMTKLELPECLRKLEKDWMSKPQSGSAPVDVQDSSNHAGKQGRGAKRGGRSQRPVASDRTVETGDTP